MPGIWGGKFSVRQSGGSSFYVPDFQGTTLQLANISQAVTDTLLCDAWGREIASTGTTVNPFKPFGQWGYVRDTSSRIYVRARHLDPGNGRWISRDPIGASGDDSNLYRYVGNNPTEYIDPSGLSAIIHEPGTKSGPQGHWFIRLDAYCSALQKCTDKSYPHQAVGLYPDPSKPPKRPPGYRLNPTVSCGAINNGPHNWNGQDPAIDPDPKQNRRGRIGTVWGDPPYERKDPAFERALCDCIRQAIANPPPFRIPSYMCPKFATDLWNCALGRLTDPNGTFKPT